MIDSCKHCIVRGDIKACVTTPCNTHDSWYAKQLQGRIRELESALKWLLWLHNDDPHGTTAEWGEAWVHATELVKEPPR